MPYMLGSVVPNLDIETTEGKTTLYAYQGNSWLLFMSHPADYTPVCTSELGRAAVLNSEFEKRNVKLIGHSCDSLESHMGWLADVLDYGKYKGKLPYPIIADPKRDFANALEIIEPGEKDAKGYPLSCRACLLMDPNHKLRFQTLYPNSAGRNFEETLRIIDSLLLADKHQIVTPCEWKVGQKVFIPPLANRKDYENKGFKVESTPTPSGKDYMRWMAV